MTLVNADLARSLLVDMIRVRRMEEKAAELYGQSRIRGFLHLDVGQEAVAVGAVGALAPEDTVVATYREHGHALVRGVGMTAIMAEMFGRRDGCSGGRGGSMHLFDADTRFLGGSAIVAGGLPLAVGVALADRLRGHPAVTACFFGDGAVAEGAFHESLNLASLWDLPVLFCCENNRYAMGTAVERALAQTDLCALASSFDIPVRSVDGMDVLAVRNATIRAAEQVREERAPRFLEYRTYRFRAHSMFDPELYRTKAEVDRWRRRDPIDTLTRRLMDEHDLTDEQLLRDVAAVDEEIAAAVAAAEASPREDLETLERDVIARDVVEADR